MKEVAINTFFLLSTILVFILLYCGQKTEKTTTLVNSEPQEAASTEATIEAESFTNASGGIKIENGASGGKFVVTPVGESWLAFDINVSETGRYKYELNADALA